MDSTDVPFLAGLLSDPDVMRYWPSPLTREESVNWLQRQRDRYRTHGFGYWLITRKTDGEPVGQAGLLELEIGRRAEIGLGYIIEKLYWNRGYATEAAAGCVKYAFSHLKVNRVVALIRPENIPSERVALRLGMLPEEIVNSWGYPHRVHVVTKERWMNETDL